MKKHLIRNFFLFAIIWLLTGFATGSATLIGPVRWIANYMRHVGWSESAEDIVVKTVIVLFIIISFLLALYLYKLVVRGDGSVKFYVGLILVVANACALWVWFHPEYLDAKKTATNSTVTEGFYFSSYPDFQDIERLKRHGFTAIISLLHPAVIPTEPIMIAKERENTKKIGIDLIEIPMLPWVSENTAAKKTIVELVKQAHGKYYVHCYLGIDRVRVFEKWVLANQGTILASEGKNMPQPRKLEGIDSFERGKIIKLEEGVYFTPFPMSDEFFGYISSGNFKQIVSLLDSEDHNNAPYLVWGKNAAKDADIAYRVMPIKTDPYDPEAVVAITEIVKKLARPIIIYAFLTDSIEAQAFVLSYITGRPSLSPILFGNLPSEKKIKVVAYNAVVGNTPTRDDLTELFERGIRNIAYTGTISDKEITDSKIYAVEIGLKWIHIDPKRSDFLDVIKNGSTWYIFGSDASEIAEALKSMIPNAEKNMPDRRAILD